MCKQLFNQYNVICKFDVYFSFTLIYSIFTFNKFILKTLFLFTNNFFGSFLFCFIKSILIIIFILARVKRSQPNILRNIPIPGHPLKCELQVSSPSSFLMHSAHLFRTERVNLANTFWGKAFDSRVNILNSSSLVVGGGWLRTSLRPSSSHRCLIGLKSRLLGGKGNQLMFAGCNNLPSLLYMRSSVVILI